jgi:DNA-binding NarL/FixJ family response regulator
VTIRVLVADDQGMVRSGFSILLNAQPDIEVIGEAVNGQEAVTRAAELRPDVILMDVRMPVLDGVAATRRLLAIAGAPPVLALTTFDDDEALAGMLRAGASGFVLKGVPAADLQQAVRIVAEGGAWLDPSVTSRVLTVYREAPAAPARDDDVLSTLTARELEVLGLIGRGRTNAEIARELFVSAGTVKTHVHHIFAKLDLRNRAAAVIFAIEHDLSGPGDDDG